MARIKVNPMNKRCPFESRITCEIAIDNEILHHSLTEAEELAHANWNEIRNLYDRVSKLENILSQNGIDIPMWE